MKIKKGTKLIAINECKMHISGAEALVIGKEYKVYHSTDKVFFIESEIDSAHEFSFDTATKYFKAKGETTAEQHQTASEQQSSVTAVEWFYDKIKSHFEHDGDLLETLTFTMVIAKVKEREQHGNTWDAAIKAHDDRGHVFVRSTCDFDDYEIR